MHLEDESLDAAVQGPFTAIRLPYKDNSYSLILVGCSGAPASLEDFGLAAHLLTGEGFETQPVNVSIPHVKLQGGEDLMGALDSMGLSSARQRPDALRGFSDQPLQITQVLHRTTIDLDEVGTVATASTAVSVKSGVAAPVPTSSPLLQTGLFCSPRDDQAGLCLMIGMSAILPEAACNFGNKRGREERRWECTSLSGLEPDSQEPASGWWFPLIQSRRN